MNYRNSVAEQNRIGLRLETEFQGRTEMIWAWEPGF